jgi:hypothetical protein
MVNLNHLLQTVAPSKTLSAAGRSLGVTDSTFIYIPCLNCIEINYFAFCISPLPALKLIPLTDSPTSKLFSKSHLSC